MRNDSKLEASGPSGADATFINHSVASDEKHTFVLVEGAWYGGWVWRDVVSALRGLGHRVSNPTLTGLGERKHLVNDTLDLSTHIEDIVNHIEMEDLWGVTIVGWSYGGMVVPNVVERCSSRIKSLIYLDAFVPENGKSVSDYYPASELLTSLERSKAENSPIPPLPLEYFEAATPEIIQITKSKIVSQPWRTFFQKVQIPSGPSSKPTSYIRCQRNGFPSFQDAAERMERDPAVRVVYLPVNHLCMLTDPKLTVETLVALA
jgi:pimeloyl-ACP methyl ester carboxylesterase